LASHIEGGTHAECVPKGLVTREWRELYIEELNDVHLTKYNSRDQIEKNKVSVALASIGERRGAYRL
jgi:hypothetical protein